MFFFNIDFSKKLFDKIYNIKDNFNEYSLLRNDNWFLYYKYKKTISKTENIKNESDSLNNFSNLINPDLHNNIFVVINESYPNFKNLKIKNSLLNHIYDKEINESFEINNYTTDWSREYSTQGAELNYFVVMI